MARVSVRPTTESARERLRWEMADEPRPQGEMFPGLVSREVGRGEFRGLEFLHVEAKRIINEIPEAARLPFRYTINAYRGCSHACTYCFARPTHEYLNLDSGRDFESKLVVKVNAVERLRAELHPKRWAGDHIAMGTNTDPYQRCEGKYRLTRGIVEVLSEHRNPFSLLTKSTLVLSDLDRLAEAASRTEVAVNFSIGTLDDEVWKATEPGTPHPLRRVEAVARLNDAGVPTGVLVAPVIPGLSDAPEQLEAVVRACVEAGARTISPITLHLRPGVREHFLGWLEEHHPELMARYRRLYPRSYAPAAVQDGLTRQVAELVERFGGRAATPGDARRVPPPPPPAPGAAPGPPVEQLTLLD